MFTRWSDKLLTGNEMIDKQHQEIFERASKMIESGKSGETKEEAAVIIDYLIGYYHRHFAAEEALQKKHQYPEYETHKNMHEQFRRELAELKYRSKLSGVNYALAVEIIIFTLDWLAKHIDKVDKQLAIYLRDIRLEKNATISESAISLSKK